MKQNEISHRKQQVILYFQREYKKYQTTGYQNAKFVCNRHLMDRLMACVIDLCVACMPVCLWEILFLLIVAGIVPISWFHPSLWITYLLLLFSIFFTPYYILKITHGQSLGKAIFHLRVVNINKKPINNRIIYIRDLMTNSLPIIVFYFIVGWKAVFLYLGFSILYTLINKHHLVFMDYIFHTRVVVVPTIEKTITATKEIKTQFEISPFDMCVHSNFCDHSTYNVEEIFQEAVKNKVSYLSICDHNCVKANYIASQLSKLYHIHYVPGVTFDCRYKGRTIQILGYGIDYKQDIYEHIENQHTKKERMASLKRVALFEKISNIKIDTDLLLNKNRYQRISGRMIARYVLHHPNYQKSPFIQQYLQVENPVEQLFQDYFMPQKSCYVTIPYPKLEDIIDIIHYTGGKCFLKVDDTLLHETEMMKEIVSKQMDGIEVFQPNRSNQDMAKLLSIAKQFTLFVSGGSNFYSQVSNYPIGYTNCPSNAYHLITNFLDAIKKEN